MNKNQIEGAGKEVAGKIQKEFGKAVDSPKHIIEGGAKEVGGKVQKEAGNIQDDIKDKRKEANREADKRGF